MLAATSSATRYVVQWGLSLLDGPQQVRVKVVVRLAHCVIVFSLRLFVSHSVCVCVCVCVCVQLYMYCIVSGALLKVRLYPQNL